LAGSLARHTGLLDTQIQAISRIAPPDLGFSAFEILPVSASSPAIYRRKIQLTNASSMNDQARNRAGLNLRSGLGM
jgi:hypothetical protein